MPRSPHRARVPLRTTDFQGNGRERNVPCGGAQHLRARDDICNGQGNDNVSRSKTAKDRRCRRCRETPRFPVASLILPRNEQLM